MAFPAIISLATIDGENGFKLICSAMTGDFGRNLATGDFNGDGQADLFVGALGAAGGFGIAYVQYGPFNGAQPVIDIAANPGFQFNGNEYLSGLGASIAALDMNADGFDDLVVGAPGRNGVGGYTGGVYVVYGGPAGATLPAGPADLDGSNGFVLTGVGALEQFGMRVAAAGDVNGDGMADLIVLNQPAGPGAEASCRAYVVFGGSGPQSASRSVADLDGQNGFALRVSGQPNYISAISGAGDFNGDGIADVILSTASFTGQYGAAYVLFGSDDPAGFAAEIDLAALDGTNGFILQGSAAAPVQGGAVSSAGDINGDGLDDLLVGNPQGAGSSSSGRAYVVFGTSSAMPASVSLAALDGVNGFTISGVGSQAWFGGTLAAAGDIDGDGFDDIIIGAYRGDSSGTNYPGAAYVILGKGGSFGAQFSVADLNGSNGFKIAAIATYDRVGQFVGGGDDLNGDGMPDLLVGAPGAGDTTAGEAYIIFGGIVENFVGGSGDDTAEGRGLGDSLSGNGGKDTLSGLGGPDTIDGGDGNDQLYGGSGDDTLLGGAGNDIMDGGDGADIMIDALGANKFYGGAGNDRMTGGSGADRMEGGDGNDTLNGNGGNDYLDGGAGINSLTGRAGNDVYIVRSAGDSVIESVGEGIDTVRAMVSYVLADEVENLELETTADINGTGNSLGNTIIGNSGANLLSGLSGADKLEGGDGDDILVGGTGRDQLTGGAGRDTFRVLAESVGLPAMEIDTVLDYQVGLDRMDFSQIDANSLLSGDQAFTVSTTGLHRVAGELYVFYTAAQDSTTLRLDVNGDGRADYQMAIKGDVTADTGGWLL